VVVMARRGTGSAAAEQAGLLWPPPGGLMDRRIRICRWPASSW